MTDSGSMANPSEAIQPCPFCGKQPELVGPTAFCRSDVHQTFGIQATEWNARAQQAATPAAPVMPYQAGDGAYRSANPRPCFTPAAPVQDDDAEFLLDLALTMNDIEAAAVRRIAARLTPDRVTPLVEALRFYANEWQQKKGDFGADPTEALYRDRGGIARAALRDGGFDDA